MLEKSGENLQVSFLLSPQRRPTVGTTRSCSTHRTPGGVQLPATAQEMSSLKLGPSSSRVLIATCSIPRRLKKSLRSTVASAARFQDVCPGSVERTLPCSLEPRGKVLAQRSMNKPRPFLAHIHKLSNHKRCECFFESALLKSEPASRIDQMAMHRSFPNEGK